MTSLAPALVRGEPDLALTVAVAAVFAMAAGTVRVLVDARAQGVAPGAAVADLARRLAPAGGVLAVVLVAVGVISSLFAVVGMLALAAALSALGGSDSSGLTDDIGQLVAIAGVVAAVALVAVALIAWRGLRARRRRRVRGEVPLRRRRPRRARALGDVAVLVAVVGGTSVFSGVTLTERAFGGAVDAASCLPGVSVGTGHGSDGSDGTTVAPLPWDRPDVAFEALALPPPPLVGDGQPRAFTSVRGRGGAQLRLEGSSYLPFEDLVAARDAVLAAGPWARTGDDRWSERRRYHEAGFELPGEGVSGRWLVQRCGDGGNHRLSIVVEVGADRFEPCVATAARRAACRVLLGASSPDEHAVYPNPFTAVPGVEVLADGRLQVRTGGSREVASFWFDTAGLVDGLGREGWAVIGPALELGADGPYATTFGQVVDGRAYVATLSAVPSVGPDGLEYLQFEIVRSTADPV